MYKKISFIVLGFALGILLNFHQSYGQSTTNITTQDEFSWVDRDNSNYITRNEWNGTTQTFDQSDLNHDGKLSRDDFYSQRQYQEIQPLTYSYELSRMDRNNDSMIYPNEWTGTMQEFNRMDQDHNGILNAGEFRQQGTISNSNLFNQFDHNNDSYISHDEWKGAIAQSFDQMDRNHDGRISRDELYNRQQYSPFIFRELDQNKDERISRSEWRSTNDAFSRLDTNRDNYLFENEFNVPQSR